LTSAPYVYVQPVPKIAPFGGYPTLAPNAVVQAPMITSSPYVYKPSAPTKPAIPTNGYVPPTLAPVRIEVAPTKPYSYVY
jgi:hypothetical protein